jgi:hypothetical protein
MTGSQIQDDRLSYSAYEVTIYLTGKFNLNIVNSNVCYLSAKKEAKSKKSWISCQIKKCTPHFKKPQG